MMAGEHGGGYTPEKESHKEEKRAEFLRSRPLAGAAIFLYNENHSLGEWFKRA